MIEDAASKGVHARLATYDWMAVPTGLPDHMFIMPGAGPLGNNVAGGPNGLDIAEVMWFFCPHNPVLVHEPFVVRAVFFTYKSGCELWHTNGRWEFMESSYHILY